MSEKYENKQLENEGWAKMLLLLEKEMPEKNRKLYIYIIGVASFLALICCGYYFLKDTNSTDTLIVGNDISMSKDITADNTNTKSLKEIQESQFNTNNKANANSSNLKSKDRLDKNKSKRDNKSLKNEINDAEIKHTINHEGDSSADRKTGYLVTTVEMSSNTSNINDYSYNISIENEYNSTKTNTNLDNTSFDISSLDIRKKAIDIFKSSVVAEDKFYKTPIYNNNQDDKNLLNIERIPVKSSYINWDNPLILNKYNHLNQTSKIDQFERRWSPYLTSSINYFFTEKELGYEIGVGIDYSISKWISIGIEGLYHRNERDVVQYELPNDIASIVTEDTFSIDNYIPLHHSLEFMITSNLKLHKRFSINSGIGFSYNRLIQPIEVSYEDVQVQLKNTVPTEFEDVSNVKTTVDNGVELNELITIAKVGLDFNLSKHISINAGYLYYFKPFIFNYNIPENFDESIPKTIYLNSKVDGSRWRLGMTLRM